MIRSGGRCPDCRKAETFPHSRDGRETKELALVPPTSFILAKSHQGKGGSDFQGKHYDTSALNFLTVETLVIVRKITDERPSFKVVH